MTNTVKLSSAQLWTALMLKTVNGVDAEWVSDCLAQGKLLPEGTHLIDLARMALQAKLQVGPGSCNPA